MKLQLKKGFVGGVVSGNRGWSHLEEVLWSNGVPVVGAVMLDSPPASSSELVRWSHFHRAVVAFLSLVVVSEALSKASGKLSLMVQF